MLTSVTSTIIENDVTFCCFLEVILENLAKVSRILLSKNCRSDEKLKRSIFNMDSQGLKISLKSISNQFNIYSLIHSAMQIEEFVAKF